MKRFTEKSKTYEFLVKFEVEMNSNEKEDDSDASEIPDANKLNVPGFKESYDHKQDKKTLRKDAKYFWNDKML